MLKLLTYSTLYPNPQQPHHGIFVEQRLRRLLETGRVSSRVVAPVPWFPLKGQRFGRYGLFARIPSRSGGHGITVHHPRYPVIPKVGMHLQPFLLAAATASCMGGSGPWAGQAFDLIDAHYFYPDGVAAALLARQIGKPLVITARGTDVNLIGRFPVPRRLIRWAASHAAAVVTVCQALKDSLVDMGVPAEKVTVLRNGVDLELFAPPDDRQKLRKRLGFDGPTLLSVGHLIDRKGHDLAIRALARLPDHRLVIIGTGERESALRQLARAEGISERVRFEGAVPHDRMRDWYGAADQLVLASSREGWANVLLESMACGTPVVATDVWGTREAVCAPEAGCLISERTSAAIADGVRSVRGAGIPRAQTRRYARGFSWEATTHGQLQLFESIVGDEGVHRAA